LLTIHDTKTNRATAQRGENVTRFFRFFFFKFNMSLSWSECALFALLLICPVFWQSSHVLRYYVKLTVFYLLIMLCAAIIVPVALLKPNNVANVG